MAIKDKLEHLLDTKQAIKQAIIDKGQEVADTDTFRSYAEKIEAIEAGGGDTIPIGMIDGTLETFNAGGAEIVAPYRCYEFENLKSVDLTGVKEVGERAFMGCRNIENLVLGSDITKVDEYALSSAGANTYQTSSFEFAPANECYLDSSAFSGALPLKTITGQFPYIGNYAFQNLYYVTNLNISGKPTYLGGHAFQSIGASRTNPESNKLYINFKNGLFSRIDSETFAGGSLTNKVKYMEIRLPATVQTIIRYAFRRSDHLDIYFYGAPASLDSSAFENATNLKIFVPFTKINAYRTATNWSAQSANIYGFADAGTFAQGQKLPMYNSEGYALTWYSDKELTQVVTEVTSPDNEYYCTAGAEKVAVGITQLYASGVDLVISDGTNQYYQDYGVPIGTTLTITATPKVSGYIPYQFTLNGETIASGDTYTAVADTDIAIIAIYWDGVNLPANPNFADNDWVIIKAVAQAGEASELGWAVGDTKPITIDGAPYNVRISDMTTGRYQYTNENRTTNMAFELVEILPTQQLINSTSTNAGGWAESLLRKNLNGLEGGTANILSTLPADLQAVLEEVQIKSANGGSSNYTGITESANKLFLLGYAEVFSTTTEQYLAEGSRWQYYAQNDTASARIKYRSGSASIWWLRSPYTGNTSSFNVVHTNGSANSYYATSAYGVSFGFAF